MTNQEFVSLLASLGKVNSEHIPDLRNLLEYYPYFTLGHLLYLRALQQDNNINFEGAANKTALYVKDRRWLYNYMFLEKNKKAFQRKIKKSDDYFDMIALVEEDGRDINQSLTALAERLKKARLATPNLNETVPKTNSLKLHIQPKQLKSVRTVDYTERIHSLMQEKRYEEALEILKNLNLNNPKKNVYFADQIRFLERIIENFKK